MMNRNPPITVIRQRFDSATEQEKFAGAELNQRNCSDCQSPAGTDVSVALSQLFSQRQAARDAAFPSAPTPGVIVRISPDYQTTSPRASTETLAVLLDAEITAGKWRGWLVGRDPGYACEWDLILGPEDEPRDPSCQVVQVWNPVSLVVEHADRGLALLPADRLAVVCALSQDFTQSKMSKPIDDHRMGVILARELTDGTGVVTGTPITDPADPRREYQQLYRDAALQISQRPAVQQTVPNRSGTEPTGFLSWIESIFGLPGRLKLVPVAFAVGLLIVPIVAFLVMHQNHEQDATGSYVSGGAFQEIRVEHPEETSRKLEATLRTAGTTPEISYESGGVIILEADLKPLTEEVRKSILATHRLSIPTDHQLRVMIVPTITPASPR